MTSWHSCVANATKNATSACSTSCNGSNSTRRLG
ncbi:hypothetical protein H257_15120 [Aphanomyces astaci]|uniref:Uncharacterized protein n=1 Tax=Aphanomyces astaci TaxID=112090 RepID=W4FNX5_APHAT|nr:hypothetical protein H257_15120 [Aphanomyces astaci]ETV69165.1 hypothetical protein H257_15120 [Aphanomyces astaci]|eukprot:XP_009841418.1 hypothetical protein H257_15120 [Aphanomyces astaci]